ncbi:DinB family protein [compost metagenome]
MQREQRLRLLSHLFDHQIHHRGQVHAMLSDTSVRAPQLDEFFCEDEAHLRAQDFAELGWTEAQIWGR